MVETGLARSDSVDRAVQAGALTAHPLGGVPRVSWPRRSERRATSREPSCRAIRSRRMQEMWSATIL
jgi:hypothetical protein